MFRPPAHLRLFGRLISTTVPVLLIVLGCRETPDSPTGPEPMGQEPAPAPVTGFAAATLSFRQLSAGTLHTCGVTTDDRAYCWGGAGAGELGDGTFGSGKTPVAVSGGLRFLEVRAGTSFTCGLTTENQAYCWGANFFGQLGDGTTTSRSMPGLVAGGRRFRQMRAGGGHVCALTLTDVAFCWGDNSTGQLGDGTTTQRATPVRVAGGLRFKQVRAGGSHSCGLTAANRAYCWGFNVVGQLGDGTQTQRLKPVAVAGNFAFAKVSTGGASSCGVTPDNRAYCWGNNDLGQLGDGTSRQRRVRPAAVADNRRFSGLSPGGDHTCGVATGGATYCWGRAYYGALGDGGALYTSIEQRVPVSVTGGQAFSPVVSGSNHSCGVVAGGQAYCWGWNASGQLGDGTTEDRSTPVAVLGP
jgi:alpha-tubulin suppressor-like RCC1 family protein